MIPAIAGAIGPLGPAEWGVGGVGGAGLPSAAGVAAGAAPSSGGFAGMLTNAIGSLEQSQAAATQASQALATGKLTDPTQAVTAVEHAALSMDFAAQMRDKLVEANNTIFQTQV